MISPLLNEPGRRGLPVFGRSLRRRLHSAETKHRAIREQPGLSSAELIVARYWKGPLPTSVSRAATAHAFVNHGRWSVRCPWCPSSQYASKTDHRFFCVECGNAPAKGQWISVTWPKNADRLEEVLCHRPDARNRNWEPGETIKDLERENREHAKEILGGA